MNWSLMVIQWSLMLKEVAVVKVVKKRDSSVSMEVEAAEAAQLADAMMRRVHASKHRSRPSTPALTTTTCKCWRSTPMMLSTRQQKLCVVYYTTIKPVVY